MVIITNEIKKRISEVQSTTTESVSSIQGVEEVIRDVNSLVLTIASAVEEQSIATSEIAGNISNASNGVGEVEENMSQISIVSKKIAEDIAYINKIKQLIEIWGISAIYETRQEMNRSTDIAFETLENNLDIIAWGLKSFRDGKDKIVKEKVKKGLKIRFIAPSPDSYYVKQREIDEKEVEGQIRKTIVDLGQWIEELKKIAPAPEDIQIKYYNSLPEDFYFRVDDYIFIGPYQWSKSSQQTISYEFKGQSSKGFAYYNDYFEKLWNSQEFCS